MEKTMFYLTSAVMIFFIGFFILLLYNGIQAKMQSVDPYDNTPDLMIIFSCLCLFGLAIFWKELYDSSKDIWI